MKNHFWYFENSKDLRIFDSRDALYLLLRFSLDEIKREMEHAQIEQAVCRAWDDLESENYWFQYRGLCEYLYYGMRWLRQLDKERARKSRAKYAPSTMSIQEIKEANDIVGVIGRYTELQGRDNRLIGLCPFHTEKHPSFNIYLGQQRWKCFGCGRNGDIIDFIKEAEKVDTAGAIAILTGSRT